MLEASLKVDGTVSGDITPGWESWKWRRQRATEDASVQSNHVGNWRCTVFSPPFFWINIIPKGFSRRFFFFLFGLLQTFRWNCSLGEELYTVSSLCRLLSRSNEFLKFLVEYIIRKCHSLGTLIFIFNIILYFLLSKFSFRVF